MRLLLSLFFLVSGIATAGRSERCICRLGLGDRLVWGWESLGSRDPAGTALDLIVKSKNQAICLTPQPSRLAHYQAKTIEQWLASEETRLRRWYAVVLQKAGVRHLERLTEAAHTPIRILVMGDVPRAELDPALRRLEMLHAGLTFDAVGTLLTHEIRNPNLHGFLARFPHVREQLGDDYPVLLRMVTTASEQAARLGHW